MTSPPTSFRAGERSDKGTKTSFGHTILILVSEGNQFKVYTYAELISKHTAIFGILLATKFLPANIPSSGLLLSRSPPNKHVERIGRLIEQSVRSVDYTRFFFKPAVAASQPTSCFSSCAMSFCCYHDIGSFKKVKTNEGLEIV